MSEDLNGVDHSPDVLQRRGHDQVEEPVQNDSHCWDTADFATVAILWGRRKFFWQFVDLFILWNMKL